jgi:predicted  nucleic acid-binding Zn-ribbon protein
MSQQQETHWRDRAINASEAISDGFEVLKAYGARIAEWVLFFCLIANIIEIFPLPEPFASVFGNLVLGVQSVTLDIAGFGLATMGDHARRRGDEKAAKKASGMGWTLIGVMILTVALVTLGVLVPVTKPYVDVTEKVLILVRVVVTVVYGHIVHSLRNAGVEFDNRVQTLEAEVSAIQKQLEAEQQRTSNGKGQMTRVQNLLSSVQEELDRAKQEVSSGQRRLEAEQQRASSLEEELLSGQGDTGQLRRELAAAKLEAESLQTRLSAKVREVEQMQADLSSVATLRRELNTAQLASEEARGELDANARAFRTVQEQLLAEQKKVSSLQRELSSVQSQVSSNPGVQVSSGQKRKGDTGQEKIVKLDSRRPGRQLAKEIYQLMVDTPGISGRAIAGQLGCSPTTANEWKGFFDKGGTLEELFPSGEAVNE